MEKKDSINEKEIKKSNFDQKKKRNSFNPSNKKDKNLPWWVELLFVQIGLPDKWLIHLLKTKKKVKELYEEEKKFIFIILLFFFALGYFQPVIKYSNAKLKCTNNADKYIKNTRITNVANSSTLRMLAINLCNGGNKYEQLEIKGK